MVSWGRRNIKWLISRKKMKKITPSLSLLSQMTPSSWRGPFVHFSFWKLFISKTYPTPRTTSGAWWMFGVPAPSKASQHFQGAGPRTLPLQQAPRWFLRWDEFEEHWSFFFLNTEKNTDLETTLVFFRSSVPIFPLRVPQEVVHISR